MAEAETETTLSTGRILMLFFGLVVMCAVFFVLGYRLEKNACSPAATATASPAGNRPAVGTEAPPPAPQSTPAADCSHSQEGCATPDEGGTAKSTPEPAVSPAASPTAVRTPRPASPERALAASEPTPRTVVPAGYIVQVAAVSKQQDAQRLLAALRKKQYPAFIATPPSDSLFHVQVGPFGEPKDAEAVRIRLFAEGYNPFIVKK
jgi:cell division septation protein DedD